MSINSNDDIELPSGAQFDPQSPGYSESQSNTESQHIGPRDLKQALQSPSILSDCSQATGAGPGYRAAEAYIRPSPIKTESQLISHLFDLRNCTFTMSLRAKAATTPDTPTEIYLPEFHFPDGQSEVSVSSGQWKIDYEEFQFAKVQRLRWWHGEGEQDIKVQGVKRKPGEPNSIAGDDVSYLEQCQQGGCIMM